MFSTLNDVVNIGQGAKNDTDSHSGKQGGIVLIPLRLCIMPRQSLLLAERFFLALMQAQHELLLTGPSLQHFLVLDILSSTQRKLRFPLLLCQVLPLSRLLVVEGLKVLLLLRLVFCEFLRLLQAHLLLLPTQPFLLRLAHPLGELAPILLELPLQWKQMSSVMSLVRFLADVSIVGSYREAATRFLFAPESVSEISFGGINPFEVGVAVTTVVSAAAAAASSCSTFSTSSSDSLHSTSKIVCGFNSSSLLCCRISPISPCSSFFPASTCESMCLAFSKRNLHACMEPSSCVQPLARMLA